jgi:hypothetical protein
MVSVERTAVTTGPMQLTSIPQSIQKHDHQLQSILVHDASLSLNLVTHVLWPYSETGN